MYIYFQPLVFIMPVVVIVCVFLVYKDKTDTYQAVLSVTLTLGLNGVITDIIKLIVGEQLKNNCLNS